MVPTRSHIPAGRPLWSLLEDAFVDEGSEHLTVHGRWGTIEIEDTSPLVREALHRMSLGPVALENISALHENFVRWKTGSGPCLIWRKLKNTLDQLGGCVVPSLGLNDGAGPILSVVAVTRDAIFALPPLGDDELVTMRRGTEIERLNGDQALACPGLAYQVILHGAPATEIAKSLLDARSTVAAVAEALQVEKTLVADVVAYLAGAGLVVPARC
ncbi:hypothetical protein SAMN05216188_104207 [Lentzea xinjiangensis]|uniref:Uncharacterized protein n=1 Tax=Lentzea xinjiangensis TaxID=402600 RepID=A0A1H9HUE3_9PSEU|nr:hypothetical protein [Lentzea xinjiangensis]SEQ65973.1 hypothetical protein SAMN05216188_104207 [Lentzea xinjiangensis]